MITKRITTITCATQVPSSIMSQLHSKLWAKESRPIAASPTLVRTFTCEDCALHCSTIFHCFIRVDGPARLLALKNSWIMDALGIQVEPPTRTKSCTFFCSMPLSRRHFTARPMELRSSPCKIPRGVHETTSASSDALEERINLNGSLMPVDFPPADPELPALQPRSSPCRHLRVCPSAAPRSKCRAHAR